MAQADGSCANASGSAFRADLNTQLAAVFTNHSGATTPATTFAYQFWADTTSNKLKIRNSANTAWIDLRGLDGGLELGTASNITIGNGTAAAPAIRFTSDTDTGLYQYAANTLGIATGGTYRLFIGDNNGTLDSAAGGPSLMWKTATNPVLNNVTGIQFTDSGRINVGNFSECIGLNRHTSTGNIVGFHYATTAVGTISVTGSSTAYNTSSDYRLKQNVVALTGAKARLNQLLAKRFNFISVPDTTVDGFLAHEAATVVPECVTGTKDEVDSNGDPIYQGIDQSKMVPLLTAALQEAFAEIAALTTRVETLEAG